MRASHRVVTWGLQESLLFVSAHLKGCEGLWHSHRQEKGMLTNRSLPLILYHEVAWGNACRVQAIKVTNPEPPLHASLFCCLGCLASSRMWGKVTMKISVVSSTWSVMEVSPASSVITLMQKNRCHVPVKDCSSARPPPPSPMATRVCCSYTLLLCAPYTLLDTEFFSTNGPEMEN